MTAHIGVAARARSAPGARRHVVQGDIRLDYRPTDAIVLLDVLHYPDPASQEVVLTRSHAALVPRGMPLLLAGPS